MSIVDKVAQIGAAVDKLLDFITTDEFLSNDFESYLKINQIEIEKQSQLNDVIINYLLDGYTQNAIRVLDYFTSQNQTPDIIINSLKDSFCSVFKIQKTSKNAFCAYCLTNEMEFELIPLVKMTNLRGISPGNYIKSRIIELEGTYYILEIYDVFSSLNFYQAGAEAIKYLIEDTSSAFWKNEKKFNQLKDCTQDLFESFKELFEGKDEIITTNKKIDALISYFNDYHTSRMKELPFQSNEWHNLIEIPEQFKYFDVKEFSKSKEVDFLQNALGGFSNHDCIYDVGLYFDEKKGLFIIPFLETYNKIVEGEEIEGKNECIKEFMTSSKIPSRLAQKYKKCDRIKEIKGFSPAITLFNSEIFSQMLGYEEAEDKKRYKNVGRNDQCPCGSGKKYKKCCMP